MSWRNGMEKVDNEGAVDLPDYSKRFNGETWEHINARYRMMFSLSQFYQDPDSMIYDDIGRAFCSDVGKPGHMLCGICRLHNVPRFLCKCAFLEEVPTEAKEAGEETPS